MPGHVVKKKPGEEDPDPTPFLVVSMELKKEDQIKPYDPLVAATDSIVPEFKLELHSRPITREAFVLPMQVNLPAP